MTDAYKVPFYILGFLIRSGPLHGYQLKTRIEHEANDFAQIKLSNLYYHLGAIKEKGWVESRFGKEGNRPEKEVFSITKDGRKAFKDLMARCLSEETLWDFAVDGVLFFSEKKSQEFLRLDLKEGEKRITERLSRIVEHRKLVFSEVPEHFRLIADLILSHHEEHYRTELKWLQNTIEVLRGMTNK
jgi:DNA-binding PadR family transcriptional regulator